MYSSRGIRDLYRQSYLIARYGCFPIYVSIKIDLTIFFIKYLLRQLTAFQYFVILPQKHFTPLRFIRKSAVHIGISMRNAA